MFSLVVIFSSVLLIGWGMWLDQQAVLEQLPLFTAFHAASLIGVVLAVVYLWPRLPGWGRKTMLVVAALIIWRVSYFPIMVWAGWVATLGEWLLIQTNWFPTVIYPTFLFVMALMNALAIILGGLAVHHRRVVALPVLSVAFVIAAMVSFTDRSDLTVLPDHNYAIEESLPQYHASEGNPYYPAVALPGYNLPERVLIFASGFMFSAIPSTPWSTTVKAILEHEFRNLPKASSDRRVVEHYLAFRSAQEWIACEGECRLTWRLDETPPADFSLSAAN